MATGRSMVTLLPLMPVTRTTCSCERLLRPPPAGPSFEQVPAAEQFQMLPVSEDSLSWSRISSWPTVRPEVLDSVMVVEPLARPPVQLALNGGELGSA